MLKVASVKRPSHGPKRGQVIALAVDVQHARVLFAGTHGHGLFKSVDRGRSWRAVNAGLGKRPDPQVAVLASAPQALFAGTVQNGVFKSTDRGKTWTKTNAGLAGRHVGALVLDRRNPQTLYAGTEFGVDKSTDGGLTWRAVDSGLVPGLEWTHALAIDPRTPSTLYASTTYGLFKSIDGGGTWRAAGLRGKYVPSLAIDSRRSGVVYAGTFGGGVFKSTNGGATWRATNVGLSDLGVWGGIVVDPTNPRIVYVGTAESGVFRSINAGVDPGDRSVTVSPISGSTRSPSIVVVERFTQGPSAASSTTASRDDHDEPDWRLEARGSHRGRRGRSDLGGGRPAG